MVNQASSWNELIVAMATPPGVGAIGVIRLSGAGSIELINSMFPSKDLTVEKGNSLHVGVLIKDDIALDEVVLSLFRTPR